MKKRRKNTIDFVTTGVLFGVSNGKYRLFKFTHGRDRNIAKAWQNMLLSAWRRKKMLTKQSDMYGFSRRADGDGQ